MSFVSCETMRYQRLSFKAEKDAMNSNSKFYRELPKQMFLLAAVTAVLCLAGCHSGPPTPDPRPLTLSIEPAGQAASLSIKVYIGPANLTYDKALAEDKVDQVLEKLSTTPSSDVKSFELTSAGMTLSREDPIWRIWRDQRRADAVVVIADLPKNFGGAEPERRRVVVPLDKHLWKNLRDHTVHIQVRENEVKLLDNPGM